MKYLLTGGGTGGHVYPALAIADEIRRRQPDAEFLYVGLRDRLESWVVPGRGYAIRYVRSRPFPRSRSLPALLAFCLSLGLGMFKASILLLRFRPDLIIGTGGYVSAPVLFAHGLLEKVGLSRARVFLYEPNAYPGLLNQAAGRLAERIGVAFEQAGRWFDMKRVAVVGYPVRREFLHLDGEAARRELQIPPDQKVVLAFGGSGGSRVINEAVVEALPLLRQRQDLLVLHITGRYAGSDYDAVRDTEQALQRAGVEKDTASWYRRFEYMDHIHLAFAAADLVVCRGGAGTLTEIGICGVPALIVPLATAAEDHQAFNAREMERLGAARVLYQEARWCEGDIVSRLDGVKLARVVLELFADEHRRRCMVRAARALPRRDGLELILCEIESLLEGRRPPPLNLEYPDPAGGLPADANALSRTLQEMVRRAGGVEGLEPRELAYLRYQADRLLVSRSWYEIPLGKRNVGIKLVGYLRYADHLPLLWEMLEDRTSVGLLKRLFGGDFTHGGFLRRNAIEYGVRQLKATDARTRAVLLTALWEDPYFEVRAAAAQVLGELFTPDEDIETGLLAALSDHSPLVVIRALGALGQLGRDARVLAHLEPFYLHPDWQYRQEVVRTLKRLVERGVLTPGQVAPHLDRILASSPFFTPEFPLKESLRELAELVRRRSGEE